MLYNIAVGVNMVNKESIITSAVIILITYTLGLSLVSQAFPAEQTSKTLSNAGSIQIQTTANIGIYSNAACTTSLTSLSWGTLEAGENKNLQCYIKNEGDMPLTLSLQTSDWTPTEAENYIDLTWNYDSNPIAEGSVIQITFTLSVSPDIGGITDFGFDITIVGTSF